MKLKDHHYFILFVGGLAVLTAASWQLGKPQVVSVPTETPTPTPFEESVAPLPSAIPSSGCDDHLWNFVYHPDRLPTKNDCRTVIGIVQWDKIEADGDYHIRLQEDDASIAPVNSKNINGYLVVEPICQQIPTQADAIQPCSAYDGQHWPLPAVGDHIEVTGFYTEDLQHQWMELHAVSNLNLDKTHKIP